MAGGIAPGWSGGSGRTPSLMRRSSFKRSAEPAQCDAEAVDKTRRQEKHRLQDLAVCDKPDAGGLDQIRSSDSLWSVLHPRGSNAARSPKTLRCSDLTTIPCCRPQECCLVGRPAICGEQIGGSHMRIDLYTKIILTLIALLLAVFALKPILQPTAVMAQGNFAGIPILV
jgi:hypothetical protein